MELVLGPDVSEIDFEGPVSGLLKELKVMREEVVIKVNGRLAPETAIVKKTDRVEIIKVVFGG